MMVAAELKQNTIPMRPMPHYNRKREVRTMIRPKFGKKPVAIVSIVFLLIVANLIIQGMIAQTQYRITKRQSDINALERRVNLIYLKLADLGSDKRIEQIAEEKLEMHPAHANEIAFVPVEPGKDASLVHSERTHTALVIAQLNDLHQQGFGQKFSEWIQGLGRTLAGTGPAELQ